MVTLLTDLRKNQTSDLAEAALERLAKIEESVQNLQYDPDFRYLKKILECVRERAVVAETALGMQT